MNNPTSSPQDAVQQATTPVNGAAHAATARVETAKASRYLKALCNHFNRKVSAAYTDDHGQVRFPFGECTMQVAGGYLELRVSAESEEMLARTRHVVGDHLVRFGSKEELVVDWVVGSG